MSETQENIDNLETVNEQETNVHEYSDEQLMSLLDSSVEDEKPSQVEELYDDADEVEVDTEQEVDEEPDEVEDEVEEEVEIDEVSHLKKKLGQQGNDIGELRSENRKMRELIEKFLKQPTEPGEDWEGEWDDTREATKEDYQKDLDEMKFTDQINGNRKAFEQQYPDFDSSHFVEVMKKDGLTDEQIELAQKQLWANSPLTIHTMYQRGLLIRELAKREKEIEELKAENASKTKTVKKKIANAAKAKKPRTVNVGSQTPAEDSIITGDLSKIPYEELAALLERRSKRG